MLPRPARSAATALMLGMALAMPAVASPVCDRLGFQLATLSGGDSPTVEARKFARAVTQQKRSLRELDQRLRTTGCSTGSLMVIGGPNAKACGELAAKRQRMERNLAILEQKRLALLADGSITARRRHIVDSLSANRCNEEPVLVSTPGENGTQPLVGDERMETIRVPSTGPDYQNSQFVDLGGAAVNGSFRTMCVRSCDGAYFPISSHASTFNFGRDAQVCSMMCPGTETELFYHSLYSESSDMRSAATGKRYEALRNAYRFRTATPGDNSQCGCNFSLYYKEMMRRQSFVRDPGSLQPKESAIVWLKPALRSSLATSQASADLPPSRERPYVADRKIRVIGPKFLPDDVIDFRRPQEPERTARSRPGTATQ